MRRARGARSRPNAVRGVARRASIADAVAQPVRAVPPAIVQGAPARPSGPCRRPRGIEARGCPSLAAGERSTCSPISLPLVVAEASPVSSVSARCEAHEHRERAAFGAEDDELEPEPARRPPRAGGRCSTTTRSGGRAGRRRAAGRWSRVGGPAGGRGRGRERPGARAAGWRGSGRCRRPPTTGERRATATGAARSLIGAAASARPRSAGSGRRARRSSRAGIHQFQWPSRRIVAGTSSARTTVASRATAIAMPRPEGLDQHDVGERERARDDDHDQRRRGHDPAAALEAARDGLGVVAGPVPGLLHPRQQEHLVVHRQPEQDAEQDHRQRGLDEARAAGSRAAPTGCRPGRSRPARRSWRRSRACSSPAP